jgi:hypothetical protein
MRYVNSNDSAFIFWTEAPFERNNGKYAVTFPGSADLGDFEKKQLHFRLYLLRNLGYFKK